MTALLAVAIVATVVVLVVLATMVAVHVSDRLLARRWDRGVLGALLAGEQPETHQWLGDDDTAGPSGLQGRMEAVVTGQVPTFDELLAGRHARVGDYEVTSEAIVTDV